MDNPFYCLKSANGINIPYTGFISTDLTVGDETITDVGIFVTKTPSAWREEEKTSQGC